MEFNMLKLSQKLKLLDQLNKTTWISLRFTPLDYSFYILQLLSIFCHFVHPKCPWHFKPHFTSILTFCTPGVFFDFGVLESHLVGSGRAKMRRGPYLEKVEKSNFNCQLIANQLPIALFVSLSLFVEWDRIVNCAEYKRLSRVTLKWKFSLLLTGN